MIPLSGYLEKNLDKYKLKLTIVWISQNYIMSNSSVKYIFFFFTISPMKGMTDVLIPLLHLQKWLFFHFSVQTQPFKHLYLWKYAEHLTHMTLMTTYLSMRCPLTTGRSSYQKFCKPGYGLRGERRLLIIWFKSLTAISTEGQTTTCFKSTTQIINIVCLCLHFWDSANINLIYPNIYRLRLVIWKKSVPKW